MASFEIDEKPEFTREIRKFEATDPAHADLFNSVIGPLLQNEVFLKSFADKLSETIIDTYQQATGYTDQEIAKLINGAPTTLDTLGEVAAAMQANQDVVSALNQAIGTKANQKEMESALGNKLDKTGDASETSAAFSQASTRANLTSGEKLKVSLGKIMKWFADLANGAASTLLGTNLTANRALVANASGKVAAAGVTATELGYLSGVTSGIQGQLNSLNTGIQGTAANSDKLEGYHGSSAQAASTYVLRDGNGYTFHNYINSNTSNGENPSTVSQVIVTNGTDNYYRKASLAHVSKAMSASGILATGIHSNYSSGTNHGAYIAEGTYPTLEPAKGTISGGLWYVDDEMTLGVPWARWKQLYATNSTISTSDRNQKKDIKPLTQKHIDFFMLLQPVSFLFKNGDSGRTHIGFIAQDVEAAMEECGLTSLDFAGFCKDKWEDEEGNLQYIYSLRYEEFIALNTHMIQDLCMRASLLEHENDDFRSRIGHLEGIVLGRS